MFLPYVSGIVSVHLIKIKLTSVQMPVRLITFFTPPSCVVCTMSIRLFTRKPPKSLIFSCFSHFLLIHLISEVHLIFSYVLSHVPLSQF